MSKPGLRAAILVVSTTSSKDPSTDTSGGILQDVFEKEGAGQWTIVETRDCGRCRFRYPTNNYPMDRQESPVQFDRDDWRNGICNI